MPIGQTVSDIWPVQYILRVWLEMLIYAPVGGLGPLDP